MSFSYRCLNFLFLVITISSLTFMGLTPVNLTRQLESGLNDGCQDSGENLLASSPELGNGSFTIKSTVINRTVAKGISKPIPKPKTKTTTQPTTQPTTAPITQPTTQPAPSPTTQPTTQPTTAPATQPTTQPTTAPTTKPTTQPTSAPTTKPTAQPTTVPATQPTAQPTTAPTAAPSPQPTAAPTTAPVSGTETKTFYVSITGNDGNPGSAASPFRTISKAIQAAPSDSTIKVASGVYQEKLIINGKSGLTICSSDAGRPVLSGSIFSSGYLVDISGSQNIIFNGFQVVDFKGNNLECIMIRNASKNIEIAGCIFQNIGTTLAKGNAHVILASGNSNTPLAGIVIKNNEIFNCTTGWSESVTMEGNVNGFSITGNKIHDVTNIAIDATGFYDSGCTTASMNQARNGRIANNLIYNLSCSYASCAGIYVDGGRDIIIENNTIHNAMYGIEIGCEKAYDAYNPTVKATVSGIIVRSNTIYSNTEAGISIGGYNGTKTGTVTDSQIYSNTTWRNTCELVLGRCDNITLTNNIFNSSKSGDMIYNETINAVTRLIMNNNQYYADGSMGNFELNGQYAEGLAGWQTLSGQDQQSVFADPQFTNPTSSNFSLKPGSPAVGKGAY